MNILMLTNTYLPHVGGVAKSVDTFARYFRERGHQVLIVAPEFAGAVDDEWVVRVPAIQNFNGSDFAVRLPIPTFLFPKLNEFKPDIVHSHHPFLFGDTALRIAARWNVPIVFTHHTMYERYTHYVPGNSRALKEFAVRLVTGYANLCDRVFAPSESVRDILLKRGVDTPISVVPTGVDSSKFEGGDGAGFRMKHRIPAHALLLGHVGRLAPEKNLHHLARVAARFMLRRPGSHLLVVGEGISKREIENIFAHRGLSNRLHLAGSLTGQDLIDAYAGMDVFIFASQTETQGMVIAEAMAAGVPVIALDAPGAREVVKDRVNGLLVKSRRPRAFIKALRWFDGRSPEEKTELARNAHETGKAFDISICAEKALVFYRQTVESTHRPLSIEGSAWESTLRLSEAEFDLVRNKARAALLVPGVRRYMPGRLLRRLWHRVRRSLSRSEWSMKLLGLQPKKGVETEPGLVLVQIDGLSRSQFETAVQNRKMPFIRRLLNREGYALETFYSGLPSTTPAVQGELFYGRKAAVPAFGFLHRETDTAMKMIYRDAVKIVEDRLRAEGGDPLLKDGTCYSDIYGGGAAEVHFSPSAFDFQEIVTTIHPLSLLSLGIWYSFSLLRAAGLTLVEMVLAVVDSFFGAITGYDIVKEVKFIPSRVAVCILLRELCTIGAIIDVTRGVPIVHVNFLGYDEQAHRRGPGSRFAHWTLKGIDNCIHRLWSAAKRSPRRSYQVWIYSDHGQAPSLWYEAFTGQSIDQAIEEVFRGQAQQRPLRRRYKNSVELERARWLGGSWVQKFLPGADEETLYRSAEQGVQVFAVGPLGHIYLSQSLDFEKKREIAEMLVKQAFIPLVLLRKDRGTVYAWTEDGMLELPADGEKLFNPQLPYFPELVADVVSLCSHPDAGDLIISGYSKHARSTLTFPLENGSHGGPSTEETRAMLILPRSYSRLLENENYVRPLGLRTLAQNYLEQRTEGAAVAAKKVGLAGSRMRVMTYNVHSCLGTDGKVSTGRIGEVIARYEPDIVCLQELDVGRSRSGSRDQAQEIAEHLAMDFFFHAAFDVKGEQYGDAVLSRYPLELRQVSALPSALGKYDIEPRGALWAIIDLGETKLQIINTHLGLLRRERVLQVDELMSERWLSHPDCSTRTVFCGDLNATPGSYVYHKLTQTLLDSQAVVEGHRTRKTWSSRYPVRCIDYIFVTRDLLPRKIIVPRTELTRLASDHLPLIADIEWR